MKIAVWTLPESDQEFIIPGVWDVVSAAAAKAVGARRAVLAGSALATAHGLPDLGLLGPEEISRAAFEIIERTGLPVMVDAEIGGVSRPTVARFIHRLKEAGVGAVLIEDQNYTGQSTSSSPALCDADEMRRRIDTAKEASAGDMRILARTDILGPGWSLEEAIRRLGLYLGAGADWVTAVYVRSKEELVAVAEAAPGRGLAIIGRGSTGYVPSTADVRSSGLRGYVTGGQERVAMKSLIDAYRLTMDGALAEVQARGISAAEFAELLDYQTYSRLA